MPERLLHGLIQRARLDASTLDYKVCPGGKGFRVWKRTPVGWSLVGELADRDDAEDFLVGKLSQEDR